MGHRALCISVCEDTGVPVMSVLFLVSREFWSQNELGVFPFTILEWFVYNYYFLHKCLLGFTSKAT